MKTMRDKLRGGGAAKFSAQSKKKDSIITFDISSFDNIWKSGLSQEIFSTTL